MRTATIFEPDERVRVVAPPFYRTGTTRHEHPSVSVGDTGVIVSGPDSDGDYSVRHDNDRHYDIAPECLAPVDAPATGATLALQVRLFLGDKDVTEALSGLFA